jgi:hypothetical protein
MQVGEVTAEEVVLIFGLMGTGRRHTGQVWIAAAVCVCALCVVETPVVGFGRSWSFPLTSYAAQSKQLMTGKRVGDGLLCLRLNISLLRPIAGMVCKGDPSSNVKYRLLREENGTPKIGQCRSGTLE